MKSPERVAVVIPAYNEEQFLRHCLDALSRQTLPPNRIYVVDNNSTDSTAAIAAAYPLVTLLKEPVQGICAASKRGLDVASETHDIILRCDADSRPPEMWTETVLKIFKAHPEYGAVTGPGTFYDTNKWRAVFLYYAYMLPYFWSVGLAMGKVPLFGSNMAVKAKVWQQISGLTHLSDRQDIHDDIDISYHIPDACVVRYERTLIMPVSARPFLSLRSMKKRYVAGFVSIRTHWPKQSPYAVYQNKIRAVSMKNE